ncbi:flavodoxin family protein [Acinetobacter equi]|uniref:Flavodoxin n=1 Tax=Acinetobacter equi TaxID=1324350 RepID=A0A0N9VZ19_9GAMM|nr:flavodoxin family protein [Acinetobacter equi]ALH95402.1 flavodoxin [Acinetobacter equi]
MSVSASSLAIVYHSPYGHTQKVAEWIAQGALTSLQRVVVMNVESVDWDYLDVADAIVFGCPTYMGSLSAAMKLFMEQSSKRWLARTWQGKLAAGFTNGGGLSGDKLAVLQQINLFAMQHGMLWTGLPIMPTGRSVTDLNRMSSFLGLMTQSDNAPVDVTPPKGDLETAFYFGEHIAQTIVRIK